MLADADFPEDPTRPSVAEHVAAGNSIEVSWKKQAIAIGTGLLLSTKDKKMPNLANAFRATNDTAPLIFRRDNFANYRKLTSSNTANSSEHLTVGLKVEVDIAGGLLSGSAQGQYDRQVDSNSDVEKYSIHASYRYGSIAFRDPPELSYLASTAVPARVDHLARIDDFVNTFGDYYVAALVLGADNSVMVSSSRSSSSTTERLSLTVEVDVLCFSESKEFDTSSQSRSDTSDMSMVGFDSLEGAVVSTPPDTSLDVGTLRAFVTDGQSLESRVSNAFRDIGLIEGDPVSPQQCTRLCEAGLVVSLILMPFARCDSYVAAWNRRTR